MKLRYIYGRSGVPTDNVLICNINGYQVYGRNINTLRGTQWVDDVVCVIITL
jgi:hypothetical protein